MIVLGIETSCDETAAAVYQTGKGILSNQLFSQTEEHKKYGGVVPEISSRAQIEKIRGIVDNALVQAGIPLERVDVIAVTYTPGLPGSLLVGLSFAKALAYAGNKKLIGVNHLEGHAFSALIENSVPFPFLCLTASGGHTALYRMEGLGDYQVLGQTADDAAGEAFDKIARMLGYPYPGGPLIEQLAGQAGFQDFFHYPRLKKPTLAFSFSGLKTAVMYDLMKKNAYDLKTKTFTARDDIQLQREVASSVLVCIADIFVDRVQRALQLYPEAKALTFVGGVACNRFIRSRLQEVADQHGIPFFTPSFAYCTDNGAMIAFVGHYKAQQGLFADLTLDLLY